MKTPQLAIGLLLFVFIVAPAQAAPPTVAGLVELFDNAQLAPNAANVSNLKITNGHLEIMLESGKAALVTAGSDPIGVFFKGNGSLKYVTPDPVEFPITSFNARKASNVKVTRTDQSLTMTQKFDEMFFWTSGGPLPQLPAGNESSSSLSKSFADHRLNFSRDQSAPGSHLFVLQRLSFPGSPVIRAEFGAGNDPLLYVYDPIESKAEGLYSYQGSGSLDSETKRFMYPIVLSELPLGRDRKTPPAAPFFLTHLDFTLTASDGTDAELTVQETVMRQSEAQTALRFSLWDKLYYKEGVAPRLMNLRSVKDSSGRELSFHHQNGDLIVGVPGIPGTELKVTFKIDGNFLIRPGGDNFWQLGVAAWFPQPDFNGQFYTVHSLVKVKKPYIAFAPGKTIVRKEEGEYNVVENVLEKPVQFAVVHAGKYSYEEETKAGVTVRVASYGLKKPQAMKKLTNLAFSIMDYYTYFLGPFPFPEFNILEINSYGFGQAPPGTMFITAEAFNPAQGELNRMYSQGINERFAHEIAHQYWGHVVKMPSGDEQWITEAFAEYSAALVLKKFKGKAVYDRLVANWKDNAQRASETAPIALANRVAGDPMVRRQNRTWLMYDKGAYLLYDLHKQMGDDQFLTFLKSFQASFRWKYASTKEIVALLQFVTKKDYSPFFEANYWGTGLPK